MLRQTTSSNQLSHFEIMKPVSSTPENSRRAVRNGAEVVVPAEGNLATFLKHKELITQQSGLDDMFPVNWYFELRLDAAQYWRVMFFALNALKVWLASGHHDAELNEVNERIKAWKNTYSSKRCLPPDYVDLRAMAQLLQKPVMVVTPGGLRRIEPRSDWKFVPYDDANFDKVASEFDRMLLVQDDQVSHIDVCWSQIEIKTSTKYSPKQLSFDKVG
jgi:hypothetical protein